MKLSDYFRVEGHLTPKELAEKSGVSYTTIKSCRNGLKLVRYDIAKKIQDATSGKVTVKELCE